MAETLVVSPTLRPWLKSGLSFLLLDSEERAAELRTESRQTGRTAALPSTRSTETSAAHAQGRPAATQSNIPTTLAGQGEGHTQPGNAAGVNRSNGPQNTALNQGPDGAGRGIARNGANTPRTANFSAAIAGSNGTAGGATDTLRSPVSDSAILPPEAWPPAWQALKNRRPLPPRPLVFWTYAGLGDDLMGTPDAVRQQIIVRMLTALHHPGGTHVFWPYALPDDEPTTPDAPSLFWSGAALLRPRAVLLFGSEARDALNMPKSLVPYCQERIAGRLVIQLPQPSSLVGPEGNDDAFRRALAFLSRLLNFCAAR